MNIYTDQQYCVYLTTYHGNKLPMFYIGSTSIDKINRGYHGSVKSKKYKDVYIKELLENPTLFKTKVIAKFYNRTDALLKECYLQTQLNVVKSEMYYNMSIAKNFGWFGMRGIKEESPVFGKRWKKTHEQIERSRLAIKCAFNKPEYKKMISEKRRGKLPMSIAQKTNKIALYSQIFNLYKQKPTLDHGHKLKNGLVLSYDRAFSKTFCEIFNLTSNGLYGIIVDDRICKDKA